MAPPEKEEEEDMGAIGLLPREGEREREGEEGEGEGGRGRGGDNGAGFAEGVGIGNPLVTEYHSDSPK